MATARWMRHSPRVRRRASKLVLAAGFVLVFALMIGLVRLTRSAPPPLPRLARSAAMPSHGPAPLAEAPDTVRPIEARPRPAANDLPRGNAATPVNQPQLALPVINFTRDLKRDENGHLVPIYPVQELRTQLHLTEPAMKACVERWAPTATGKATLNFTVASRGHKPVIDTTGTQDEDTLAAYPELLDCMHRTATLLAFDGRPVPELGTPIYVRRHVQIENGVVTENSLFDFSYHP